LYYNNAFRVNAGDPRATLKVVNELHARKSTNSNVNEIEMNGHSIADVQELAKTFNYHFASVGPKKAMQYHTQTVSYPMVIVLI